MPPTPPFDAPTAERTPIRAGGTLSETQGVDVQEQFDRIDRADESANANDSMPARIGRFVVLAPLGAGGMGIVYAAYDPELDRRVAIKLWRRDVGRRSGQHDALLAETRAMARIAHVIEARAVLRRAVELYEGADGPDPAHGSALWGLAQAMADPPDNPDAARALAQQTLLLLEKDEHSPLVATLADVRAWLAEHL